MYRKTSRSNCSVGTSLTTTKLQEKNKGISKVINSINKKKEASGRTLNGVHSLEIFFSSMKELHESNDRNQILQKQIEQCKLESIECTEKSL